MGRKFYLEAIRALPGKWIDDETDMTTFISEGFVDKIIVVNPKYQPMEYVDGQWGNIALPSLDDDFTDFPITDMSNSGISNSLKTGGSMIDITATEIERRNLELMPKYVARFAKGIKALDDELQGPMVSLFKNILREANCDVEKLEEVRS